MKHLCSPAVHAETCFEVGHDVILTISKKNGMWLRRTMDSVKPVKAGKKEVYRLLFPAQRFSVLRASLSSPRTLDENFF